ncbi:DUF2225 domain-containing protein [Ferviditalea candida]|uniref:DUF2225 domain-containing protein n=1 Tax=Ferviditalea candida TaxID=3108399 RepID=A0ABU5ZCX9_9BACL|nr:DUF2225 domain-containing protein [Paenibacillaceae bacterium T2]
MLEPLYRIDIKCPVCENSFKTSKVRPSFKKSLSSESDFFNKYKDINPDFYIVRVCPFCGYSSTENFENRLTGEMLTAFAGKVSANWSQRDFGQERSWDEALQTLKLGLICAQIAEEKDRVIAGLLHHIAWRYRERGDKGQELRFLQFALEAYIKVYELEAENVNNARLMYLIGELNRRVKKYYDAVKWFSRVIHDKKIVDGGMIRASKEQWMLTRQEMIAAKLELPEEMKEDAHP